MLLAYGQLAAAMALVGLNVAVAKLLAAALPIALIAWLRCLLACAVLLPLAGRTAAWPGRGLALNLLLQALFGTALYNAALLAGLRRTTALEGGLVLAALPAVVSLGSALLLRETLAARQRAAALLAAGGMAALTLAGGGTGGGTLAGNALVLAAVCGEAGYVLLAKRAVGRISVVGASLWMQCFSALLLTPFALPDLGAVSALTEPHLLLLLVFHSLTASVLCLLLWYAGLRRVPAGLAGVFTIFLPGTATLAAIAWLGERCTAMHVAGFVLMLGSLLLATWPGRRVPA